MATRQNDSGRIQPTEGRYLAEPGYCAICMKTPDNMEEIFANPSIELEHYGCIYFCQNCCAEVGAFVMMVPQVMMDSSLENLNEAMRQNFGLQNQNAYLKGLLNARIDLAGGSEPLSDVPSGIPLSETELISDDLDSIIDSLEPNAD